MFILLVMPSLPILKVIDNFSSPVMPISLLPSQCMFGAFAFVIASQTFILLSHFNWSKLAYLIFKCLRPIDLKLMLLNLRDEHA